MNPLYSEESKSAIIKAIRNGVEIFDLDRPLLVLVSTLKYADTQSYR